MANMIECGEWDKFNKKMDFYRNENGKSSKHCLYRGHLCLTPDIFRNQWHSPLSGFILTSVGLRNNFFDWIVKIVSQNKLRFLLNWNERNHTVSHQFDPQTIYIFSGDNEVIYLLLRLRLIWINLAIVTRVGVQLTNNVAACDEGSEKEEKRK